MTTPLLAVVQLTNKSGLPEDRVDTDFAFLAADATSGTTDGIASSLINFYNEAGAAANNLMHYIGPSISRTAESKVNFYDLSGHLDGTPHGSPIAVYSWTPDGAASGVSFPTECAVALSFHGDLTGIVETSPNPAYPPDLPKFFRPAARRRGRVFIGPITSSCGAEDANGSQRPGGTFVAQLATWIAAFMDERADFAVWSRVDEALYLVNPDGGWSVDNAYDTIRKRGPAGSSRTLLWP